MPLITTAEELRTYCPAIILTVDEDTFEASVTHAERNYLIPELGKEQYTALLTAYENSLQPAPITDELSRLLDKCRAAIAPLAVLHYKHMVMIRISDGGTNETATENGEMVRMWANNLQNEVLFENGMQELDNLLQFLDENIADYPDYEASSAYETRKNLLLQSTSTFNAQVDINNSRRLFKRLLPAIARAEEYVIKKHIGPDLYIRLIDAIKANDLTNEEKEVLRLCFEIIPNMAMVYTNTTMQYGNNGAYTLFTEMQYSSRPNQKLPSPEAIEAAKQHHQRMATQSLDALVAYLNSTASNTVLTEYFNSPLYKAPNDAPEQNINQDLNNIFVF